MCVCQRERKEAKKHAIEPAAFVMISGYPSSLSPPLSFPKPFLLGSQDPGILVPLRGEGRSALTFSSVCASAQRTKGQESTHTGIRLAGEIDDP